MWDLYEYKNNKKSYVHLALLSEILQNIIFIRSIKLGDS